MADGQILEDAADLQEDVPPGWHPQGLLAGLPAMNAAAGQSTLGALMTPQQIADVDWGDDAPNCDPGFDMQLAGADPDPGFDAPWTVSGQDPGFTPPCAARPQPPTADQIDPDAPGPTVPDPGLNGHGYRPAPGDDALLTRILMAESANTPGAMEDVGWAIVNRVGNPDFRPTLPGVIDQPGQFESRTNSKNGYWARTDPANDPDNSFTGPDANSWAHADAAAQGILNGTIPDGTGGATYFFSSPKYNPQDQSNAPGDFPGMLAKGQLSPVSAYDNNTGTNRTYIFRKVDNP